MVDGWFRRKKERKSFLVFPSRLLYCRNTQRIKKERKKERGENNNSSSSSRRVVYTYSGARWV